MLSWFRRSARRPQGKKRRAPVFRPFVEGLEDRRLMAAPVINTIAVPLNVPTGKTLIVPVTASDPAGGAVTYSVTSNNPNLTVTPLSSTNTFIKMSVQGFGDMVFELYGDLTPNAVQYITGLIESEFYNGLGIDRVEPGFVIQGGSPNKDATGGPPGPGATQAQVQALQFNDEFNSNLIYSGSGQLALANGGHDTNGSQFFVTVGNQRASLDFGFTMIGQLVRGFDVLTKINSVPITPFPNNSQLHKPVTPIVISDVEVIRDTTDAVFVLKSTAPVGENDTITVTATASTGGTSARTFTVHTIADSTNDPPFLGPISNQVIATGSTASVTLTATDLENNALTFGLTNTDNPTNAAITQDPNNPAHFTVTPNPGFTGTIHLRASVTDATATRAPDTQDFSIAVGDQSLTGTAAASISASEGVAVTNVPVATFTDTDLTALPTDFTVAINWGDGTALDSTSGKVTGAAGAFTVTGTHTFKDPGHYTVKVMILDSHTGAAGTDKGGATATVTMAANVADVSLSGQGATVNGFQFASLGQQVVATFTDSDNTTRAAGHYAATIAWGDGTSSAGTVVSSGSAGHFTVLGDHTYGTSGTFSTSVTITDLNPNRVVPAASLAVQGSASIMAAASNQAFVIKVFQDVLNRSPDNEALTASTLYLATGGTRLQFAQIVVGSPESRAREVLTIYLKYLKRAPSLTEAGTVMEFLNRGNTVEHAAAVLIGSQEYFTNHGGTNDSFAAAAFSDILGHPLDTKTQNYLSQQISANGVPRTTVANWLFESNEGAGERVLTIFNKILDRPTFPSELQQYSAELQQGLHDETLTEQLISVPEYDLHP